MSQHDTLTLEPCPFCGALPDARDVGDYFVSCPACGIDGPAGLSDGREAAANAWNRRAALSATQPAQAAQSDPVKPLFASKVAARKWSELQEAGARMQSIAFDGHKSGQAGTIDPWGVVRWGQAAQGAGEVVAWMPLTTSKGGRQAVRDFFRSTLKRHDFDGYISETLAADFACVLGGYLTATHTQPAAGSTPPPAQPAPVVPDVQREIAAALALFPIDLVIQTFRVNSYNQSQVIEADGDTQFFSKKKVMALLEKLHGHLTAAATPTPPAQAAADARDAGRYRLVRRGQHWSVINGIGDTLRGEDLDAAIDAQL